MLDLSGAGLLLDLLLLLTVQFLITLGLLGHGLLGCTLLRVIGLRLTLVHQTLLFLLFFADLLGLLLVDQTCLEQLIAKGKAHCLLTYTVTAPSAAAGCALFLTFGFAPQRVHFFERARFDRTLEVAQSLFNESEASVELAIGRA